ncbi:MAG: biopolymer transporter ExbD [Acidobacteriota bacterium]|nr:MAG: biopolymer transporter ExbD [Acidobacteriota bacterium]
MAFRIHKRAVPPVIPTCSMADIAFLLIVFFMVTTTFQVDRTQVDPPKTVERYEVVRGSAYIVLSYDGDVYFTAGEETSEPISGIEDLPYFIMNVTSVNAAHPFVIKADYNVKYDRIDRVIEMLKEAEARNIYFLSAQKTVEDVRS